MTVRHRAGRLFKDSAQLEAQLREQQVRKAPHTKLMCGVLKSEYDTARKEQQVRKALRTETAGPEVGPISDFL